MHIYIYIDRSIYIYIYVYMHKKYKCSLICTRMHLGICICSIFKNACQHQKCCTLAGEGVVGGCQT